MENLNVKIDPDTGHVWGLISFDITRYFKVTTNIFCSNAAIREALKHNDIVSSPKKIGDLLSKTGAVQKVIRDKDGKITRGWLVQYIGKEVPEIV